MARILDKDTRLIDVDFGSVSYFILRGATELSPGPLTPATNSGTGVGQLITFTKFGDGCGSFIQFQRLDLDYMTMNNEVMQPIEVSVQRTGSAPFGGTHENGNNVDNIQEFIVIASRPLNIDSTARVDETFWNSIGLNRGTTEGGGVGGGGLTHDQNIYAEKRTYSWVGTNGATVTNGELTSGSGLDSYFQSPQLVDLNTWGSLSAITGPNLYCYRVVINKTQTFPNPIFSNIQLDGVTTLTFQPVNVAFLCKDPKYTEGQYLTRLANAMNSIPEGGPTK